MDKMKNSGMSETMQTLMRKSACVMLSLLLLLSAVLPVKAAAETAPAKGVGRLNNGARVQIPPTPPRKSLVVS